MIVAVIFYGFSNYSSEKYQIFTQKIEIARLNHQIETLETTLSFIPNKTADYTNQISKLHSIMEFLKDLDSNVIDILMESLKKDGYKLNYEKLGVICNTIFGTDEYYDNYSSLQIDSMTSKGSLLIKVLKFTQLPLLTSIKIVNASASDSNLFEFLNYSLPKNLHELEVSFYNSNQGSEQTYPSQKIFSVETVKVIENV